MTKIFASDLFRNFLGGFAIGAIAMFVLVPEDGMAEAATPAIESPVLK